MNVYCKNCFFLKSEYRNGRNEYRCSVLIDTWFSEKDQRRNNIPSEKNKNNDCKDFKEIR